MMRSNRAMDQAIAIILAFLLSTHGAAAADRVQLTQAERPQTETKPAQGCAIKGNVAASGDSQRVQVLGDWARIFPDPMTVHRDTP